MKRRLDPSSACTYSVFSTPRNAHISNTALHRCYTNHTLDQFLENLLKDGITNIVRIGSRSKSEAVAALALRTVVRRVDRTRLEYDRINTAKANLVEAGKRIKEAYEQLLHPQDPHVREGFLGNKNRSNGVFKTAISSASQQPGSHPTPTSSDLSARRC